MSTAEELSLGATGPDNVALHSEYATTVNDRMDSRPRSLRHNIPSSPITTGEILRRDFDGAIESDRENENASRGDSSSVSLQSNSEAETYGGLLVDQSSSDSDGEDESSFHPALDRAQHRRLTDENVLVRDAIPAAIPTSIGRAIMKNMQRPENKRTLVVYSGPTSLDRTIGKNDVYLTNLGPETTIRIAHSRI